MKNFKFINIPKFQILIIVLFTFFAYSNIFQNEFILDDLDLLAWSKTKSFTDIPSFFTSASTPAQFKVYRPLAGIYYFLCYKIMGENVVFYHLLSLFIHIGATILIYFITVEIIRRIKVKNTLIPFATALLFGLHPIHTEAITFFSPSTEIFGSLFLLGSFYCYMKVNYFKPVPIYFLSLLFAFLAIYDFELWIVIPLLIFLFDLFIRKTTQKKKLFFSTIIPTIPFFLIALSYIFIKFFVVHIGARGEYLGGSFYHTMLTMMKAHIKYIYLLIFPINLSLNQTISEGIKAHLDSMKNFNAILSQSILDKEILAGLLIFVGIVWSGVKSIKKNPLVTFAIGWFFIGLLPVSYLIPQGPIMQERYIYIASFGFCLLLGWFFNWSLIAKKWHSLAIIIFVIVIALYGYRTFLRNKDYKNHITLWTHQSNEFPDDVQAAFTAANLYANFDDNQATYYYMRALKKDPDLPEVYKSLGQIYLRQGKKDQAISNFNQALLLDSSLFAARLALNKLGVLSDWKFFEFKNILSFYYPENWDLKSDNSRVIFTESSGFNVDLIYEQFDQKPEEYLLNQKQTFGKVIQEGLAQIPEFDRSYVKVWDDSGIQKLQIFLFKGSKVIKVLMYPINSLESKHFNNMLSTLKVN